MSRKQVVLIEWMVIILVAAGLAVFCFRGCFSRRDAREAEQETTEAAAGQAEGQEAAGMGTDQAESRETAAAGQAEGTEPGEKGPVRSYTLSFAGDCTIGSLLEWQGKKKGDFQSVVGIDYAYPLSGVKAVFSEDDLTTVNLEGTFTTAEDAIEKPYRFRADPAYVQVLTEGGVEAVSVSNNHSGDFLEKGLADTLATLDSAGIWHTQAGSPLIRELEGGLKLGIVSYNTVDTQESMDEWWDCVYTDIEACREAGCDLIIGFMHWGTVEYLTEPEDWEVALAHDMADWGCDLIVGGHAHILQRMEIYHDVPIFYSMGNFCYGGHLNPEDKDSVIVQAVYTWDPASGNVSRSDLRVIPCLISTREDANDYCPTLCEKGSPDYERILDRLEWTV